MTSVAVMSVKGSPGVSSTALGLAASFGAGSTLIEADLSGGSLLGRCGHLAANGPNLFDAVRHNDVAHGAQGLGEISVVVMRGDVWRNTQAAAGVARWRGVWDSAVGDVVTDMGRWVPGSPTCRIAGEADVIVLVASLEATALSATLEWARRGGQLSSSDPVLDRNRMVLVTTDVTRTKHGKVSAKELADDAGALGVRYGGHLSFDENPLESLRAGAGFGHKSVARSNLAANLLYVGQQLRVGVSS